MRGIDGGAAVGGTASREEFVSAVVGRDAGPGSPVNVSSGLGTEAWDADRSSAGAGPPSMPPSRVAPGSHWQKTLGWTSWPAASIPDSKWHRGRGRQARE